MLIRLSEWTLRMITRPAWTQNVGIARTFLALCGLGTLVFSSVDTLIRPASGVPELVCAGPSAWGLWCLVPPDTHQLAQILAITILIVAASGWRPRFTAIPMWWVLFSNQSSFTIVDGGDQIAAVLALLFIPLSLTDTRVWHWTEPDVDDSLRRPHAAVIAHTTLLILKIQVAFVYINACLSKLGVDEWLDGTAVYYWLRDPMFGPSGPLRDLTDALMVHPIPVATASWGTLFLEFFLGIAIFLPRRFKLQILPVGILFHLGIAVTMGLWSFGFAMWAALLIALWPDGAAVAQTVALWRRRGTRPRRPTELLQTR